MGPNGVHSLLTEAHTLRFNTLQLQYLESLFELVRGYESEVSGVQTSLHMHLPLRQIASFGDFGDSQRYGGFVPRAEYLAEMMNKAIERDEKDADQHTALLAPDQLDIDDSHKINKHMAKMDGVPVFGALWTCMTSRYIRSQVLTLTKSHEERMGPLAAIASSVRLFGYPDPQVCHSDDPIKDRQLVFSAFPSLSENLTPIAAAHGLDPLVLPSTVNIVLLDSVHLVESTLSALMDPLDSNPGSTICVSLDAEWNVSRTVGVSIIQIAPHSQPSSIYIIPVHKFRNHLPISLLRLLISNKVFKVGSRIKGDLSRLKKQFPAQLGAQTSFTIIDLREFLIQRGVISRQEAGGLSAFAAKVLGSFLSKDDGVRMSDDWEVAPLSRSQLSYAALDVFASRLIFEKASEVARIQQIQHGCPAGTRVALLVQEGGEIAAYGQISNYQPASLGKVRVRVPTMSRILVEIDSVVIPSAAAILHLAPTASDGKTKSGALTLAQLREAGGLDSSTFMLVSPMKLLTLDCRTQAIVQQIVLPAPSNSNPIISGSQLGGNNNISVDLDINDDTDDNQLDLALIGNES